MQITQLTLMQRCGVALTRALGLIYTVTYLRLRLEAHYCTLLTYYPFLSRPLLLGPLSRKKVQILGTHCMGGYSLWTIIHLV